MFTIPFRIADTGLCNTIFEKSLNHWLGKIERSFFHPNIQPTAIELSMY